ncbi:MAG TPA: hypothetical protein DCM38_02800 [Gammaproteobacteria bacterium]|nr:hypothetical protein [Gammaproteobacteria bacterium]
MLDALEELYRDHLLSFIPFLPAETRLKGLSADQVLEYYLLEDESPDGPIQQRLKEVLIKKWLRGVALDIYLRDASVDEYLKEIQIEEWLKNLLLKEWLKEQPIEVIKK